jgi:hypothetical protein
MMATVTPKGLRSAGKALWRAVTAAFTLEAHEELLLRQACRTADLCDLLQLEVDRDGPTLTVAGVLRAHPAAVELRQQRVVLARLVAALRVPLPDDAVVDRTQYRGVRGVYGFTGRAS